MQIVTPNEEFLARVLKILKKSKNSWKNEKELAKVVGKIEREKKLKQKDFRKIYEIFEKNSPYKKY